MIERPRRVRPLRPMPAGCKDTEKFRDRKGCTCAARAGRWTGIGPRLGCGDRDLQMKSVFRGGFVAAAIILATFGVGAAQPAPPTPPPRQTDAMTRLNEAPVREKLNAWTVGLAGGQLEGAPIRFAAEIGRV